MIKRNQGISLTTLLFFLFFACNKGETKVEVVTIVDKKYNSIEKGTLVNGKREGYWVTFDTNYVIKYDNQYKNDILNGKNTRYYDGKVSQEYYMRNGKMDGKWVIYHEYPTIYTQGNMKMDERVGEWRIYTKKGILNRIVLFEKDTFKIILDNQLE